MVENVIMGQTGKKKDALDVHIQEIYAAVDGKRSQHQPTYQVSNSY